MPVCLRRAGRGPPFLSLEESLGESWTPLFCAGIGLCDGTERAFAVLADTDRLYRTLGQVAVSREPLSGKVRRGSFATRGEAKSDPVYRNPTAVESSVAAGDKTGAASGFWPAWRRDLRLRRACRARSSSLKCRSSRGLCSLAGW